MGKWSRKRKGRKDQFGQSVDTFIAIREKKVKIKGKERKRKYTVMQAREQVKTGTSSADEKSRVELVISGDQKKRKMKVGWFA